MLIFSRFNKVAFLSAGILLVAVNQVYAQSSLGLGRAEEAIQPEGAFAGILLWIQQNQQAFYNAMRTALQAIKDDGSQAWLLIGLSFLYGVFHAAGPGHGKAIVSSYMLANEVAARRGIFLSFASAIMQAVTAIVVIGAILLLLRGSGIKSSDLAYTLEVTSYFMVMMLGIYLLITKTRKAFAKPHIHYHDHGYHEHGHHHHEHLGDHGHNHHHHDHTGSAAVCDSCGHSHAADPKQLEGKLNIREAISIILAVGLRPCSGAIIVLTFAFLNGLYIAGILSTFAMAIGTGITVSFLALLAVTAKNAAIRVAGWQDNTMILHKVIEITGAGLIFILGLLLFTAALSV